MARTVARAIQELLAGDTEQQVQVQLVNGNLLTGRLDDLQQFDDAAILVQANGMRSVIPVASISVVELADPRLAESIPGDGPAKLALAVR